MRRTAKRQESRSDLDRLLLMVQEGNREGLRQLYEKTARSIYGYALAILKQPQDAEEVMQDVYLTVWKQAEKYQPGSRPEAWLFTIARNLCYMRLRSPSAGGASLDELREGENGWEPGEPCREIEAAPEKQVLLQALGTLSEEERKLVLLHCAGGMKHREIAELTGQTLPAVLSRYSRALKKMEKVIDKTEVLENNRFY